MVVYNSTIKTFINNEGRVVCAASIAKTHTCYKWRSDRACNDCPMQKLMYRSKLNEKEFLPPREDNNQSV